MSATSRYAVCDADSMSGSLEMNRAVVINRIVESAIPQVAG
jgi:hypothetical protein